MDHWLKTGSFSKRKTTEPTDSHPSSVTNPAEENPMKKLPQVSVLQVG